MIDIKDLKTGNSVYLNENGILKKVSVSAIGYETIRVDSVFKNIDICRIQPIPLTEELIVEFGARKRYNSTVRVYYVKKLKGTLTPFFGVPTTKKYAFVYRNKSIIVWLDYLHQFQNLRLTVEEMTK